MADEGIDEQLLCRPDEKARLENRNADDQHMMLADLVDRGVTELRESHVRELKALAIRDIFPVRRQLSDLHAEGPNLELGAHPAPRRRS